MSKNKKIVILITILVIIVLGIAGIFIYKNREVDNIVIGENNNNQMQENNEPENIIDNENIIENTVENNVEQSNTVEDNTISQNQVVEESKTIETTQPVQEKNVKTSAKKENNKTTTTSKQQTTQEKTSSQPQKSEQSSKSEQQTTPVKNNDNGYKEQEVQIAPKTECTENNHKVGTGNTGKWFETQDQATAYFKTEIAKWGKQWENFEITDDEYHKNCPYGYEVWTCPQCQKWTVNFYYNK